MVVLGLVVSCAGAARPVEARMASIAPPEAAPPPTTEVDAGPTPTWTPPAGTDPELARLAVAWIDGTGVVPDPIGRVGCEVRVRAEGGALQSWYGLVVPPCGAPGAPDVLTLDGASRPIVSSADPDEHAFAAHVRTGIEHGAPDRSFVTLLYLVRLGRPALALELAAARVRYSHEPITTLYADAAMEIARAHGDAAAIAFVLGDIPGARDQGSLARLALLRAPGSAAERADTLRAMLDALDGSLDAPPVGSAADAIARRDVSALGDVLRDLHDADVRALIVWAYDDDATVLPMLIAATDRTDASRARHDCGDRILCSVGEIARRIVGDHTADADPAVFHATTLELWQRYFRGRTDAQGLEAILADGAVGSAAWIFAAGELDQRRDMEELAPSATLGASLAARVRDVLAGGATPEELCTLWTSAVHLDRASVAAQTRDVSRSPLPLAADCRDYAFMMRMEDHDRDVGADYAAWLEGHLLDPLEADRIYGIWGRPISPLLRDWLDALVGRAAAEPLADVWIAAALNGGHGLSSREVTDHALAALLDRRVVCEASAGNLRCGERTIPTRIVLPSGPVRRCDLYATALDHANALTQTRELFGDIVWDPRAPESERDAITTELARALRTMRARRRTRD